MLVSSLQNHTSMHNDQSMQNHSIGFMGIMMVVMMVVMMGAMLFALIFRRKKGKRRLFKKKEQPQVEPQLSHIPQPEL